FSSDWIQFYKTPVQLVGPVFFDFKPRRQIRQKTIDDRFFLDADNAVICSCHTDIGDVPRPLRQYPLISGLYVCVRTDHGACQAVDVPAKSELLARRLGMKVDDDFIRSLKRFFDQTLADRKRI